MEKKKPFYGWFIVGICFVMVAVPMVWLSNFYSYYQMQACAELGCTYVQYTLGSTGSTIACMLFSVLLATKVASGKTRFWMLGGGIAAGVCMYLIGEVTAVWQLIALFFLANFAFSATTYVPINVLISCWFVDKRGQATSLAFMGQGVGGMIFTPVVASIIANQSWRMGFKVTGLIVVGSALILTWFLKKPDEMGQTPLMPKEQPDKQGEPTQAAAPAWAGVTKLQAVKTPSFLFYALTCICCGILAAGIVMQIPTYFTEIGLNYSVAMTLFSGVTIFSMLVMGRLFDNIGLVKGAMITSGMQFIALVLLLVCPSVPVLGYVGMAILPLGSVIGSLGPPLVAGAVFGMKDYGGIYGLGNTFYMGGCMLGPITASSIRVASGSYSMAWVVFAAVAVLLAISMMSAVKSRASLERKYSDCTQS